MKRIFKISSVVAGIIISFFAIYVAVNITSESNGWYFISDSTVERIKNFEKNFLSAIGLNPDAIVEQAQENINTESNNNNIHGLNVSPLKKLIIKEVSRDWIVVLDNSKNTLIAVSTEKFADKDGIKRRKIIPYEELSFWDKLMLQKVNGLKFFYIN